MAVQEENNAKLALKIRRFIVRWAVENYGITPTCPPTTKEITDLISEEEWK